MNRIILIGNGFDLAHEMPTSYAEFISNYYADFVSKARNSIQQYKNDDIEVNIENYRMPLEYLLPEDTTSLAEIKDAVDLFNEEVRTGLSHPEKAKARIKFSNRLLEEISAKVGLRRWVDIEEEYYKLLTRGLHASLNHAYLDVNANVVNNNLKSIEKSLENYLTTIEKEYLPNSANSQISDKIYSKFQLKDFSSKYSNAYHEEIKNRLMQPTDLYGEIALYGDVYKKISLSVGRIEKFREKYSSSNLDENQLKADIKDNNIPDFYLVPNNILFLTFNYTHTEALYAIESPFVSTIHIHGEINSPNNPIIFGYGDELGSEYHQLENLKDDEVLKNMKSVRYLDTDNYKKLLNFIESEPYQIFIMGHSCGNSDRTLLNTLFEHKHCASVKPFFHQISEQEDNYSNIVRGISRNFKDKPSMRDRVVNKTLCEPLLAMK